MKNENKKKRPEFVAWEKLVIAQIEGTTSAINCLQNEIKAQRALLRCQKMFLEKARKTEQNIENKIN
jgi:hypothetical protein